METIGSGDIDKFRKTVVLASGFSPIDPTMPRNGKYNRRWGLMINTEIRA